MMPQENPSHAAPAARPGLARFLVIVFLGPPVGTLAYLAIVFFRDPSAGGSNLLSLVAFVLAMGWVGGLLPALIAATAWHFVARLRMEVSLRVFVCAVIGAVAGAVGALPVIVFVLGVSGINPAGVALMAFGGAVALCVTALPGSAR